MEQLGSFFDELPEDLRLSFVEQAVANLDQEHVYGVIPCVCRELRELSLSSSRSLDVELASLESVKRFGEWLKRHGDRLTHLAVDLTCVGSYGDDDDFDQGRPVDPDDFTMPVEEKYLLDTIGDLSQGPITASQPSSY